MHRAGRSGLEPALLRSAGSAPATICEADASPIGADEAEQLFAPLHNAGGLLLAVSGGPDSMALMRLAGAWAQAPGRPVVSVASVDHGLRAASRGECDMVVRCAEAIGLAAARLAWEGPKPSRALQEKAREARYALLTTHAKSIGAGTIVLAHHADDAAETVLLRLLGGSGLSGLRGMQPMTLRDGVTLSRPLLGVPKARLIATCTALAQVFVTDPSNHDSRFLRARLRRLSGDLAAEGLDRAALLRLAARAARTDEALEATVDKVFALCAPQALPDGMSFDARPLVDEPDEIVQRVLGRAIAAAAGAAGSQQRLPQVGFMRLDRLETLREGFRAAQSRRMPFKTTLFGTILSLDPTGRVLVLREGPRRRGRRQAR